MVIKRMIRMFFLATLTAQPVSVFPADHVTVLSSRFSDVYAWMTADTEQVNLANHSERCSQMRSNMCLRSSSEALNQGSSSDLLVR